MNSVHVDTKELCYIYIYIYIFKRNSLFIYISIYIIFRVGDYQRASKVKKQGNIDNHFDHNQT